MSTIIQTFLTEIIRTSILEWVAVVTGFVCIVLAAKNHILNWPIGIISIVCYIVIFFEAKLYGEIILQMYFLVSAIYGWSYWSHNPVTQEIRPIVCFHKYDWIYTLVAVSFFTLILYFFLETYTDTNVPLVDAFCTAMSFVAQYLLTRKVLQNWILWLLVDIVYVPLLFYKHLYLSSVLYFVLVIIAYKGYVDWKKSAIKTVRSCE